MEMYWVSPDLVRIKMKRMFPRHDRCCGGPAHLLESRIANIDLGSFGKEHMAASARRILRVDDDGARQVPDVGQRNQLAVRVPPAEVVMPQRLGQRDLTAGNALDDRLLYLHGDRGGRQRG